MVEGECSHHCAIPAPKLCFTAKQSYMGGGGVQSGGLDWSYYHFLNEIPVFVRYDFAFFSSVASPKSFCYFVLNVKNNSIAIPGRAQHE